MPRSDPPPPVGADRLLDVFRNRLTNRMIIDRPGSGAEEEADDHEEREGPQLPVDPTADQARRRRVVTRSEMPIWEKRAT